jgi:uncharacterized protein
MGTGTVEEVRFTSHGVSLAASLRRPDGPGPHPAVVLAPGFGAIRRARLGAYAERFRDAGILSLVFDYRHFGDSGGEPRQLLSIGRQVEDWHAALSHVRAMEGVDPSRIALWGTSFSGGHVVRVAAEDGKVAAVVAQIPFMDGISTTLQLHPVSAAKASILAALDLAGDALRRPPLTMPIVATPGRAAAMAMDEAVWGFERLCDGEPWENRVCARIGLAVPLYRPVRWARQVRCPILVQAGEADALTPPGPARKAARAAPQGEYRGYPAGHFDFYFGEIFDEAVAEQVAFLRRHLLPAPSPPRSRPGTGRGASR